VPPSGRNRPKRRELAWLVRPLLLMMSGGLRPRSNRAPGADSARFTIMERDAVRLLILSKLADGKLPLDSLPRVWGGPTNGETCDACDAIVSMGQFIMEVTRLADGGQPLHFHAVCFWIWEAERQVRPPPVQRVGPVDVRA
jgi:hypothetical protein